jgi:hypothetical protein
VRTAPARTWPILILLVILALALLIFGVVGTIKIAAWLLLFISSASSCWPSSA